MMKVFGSLFFCFFGLLACGGETSVPITTNLVVYTDIHSPSNTSHYFATRLSLSIQDGLIVGCDNQGEYDLFNGLTAVESKKKSAEFKNELQKRREEQLTQSSRLPPPKKTDDFSVRTKLDEFLQEYLGVAFGDDISKFEQLSKRNCSHERVIPVIKKFHHWDTAIGNFTEGKLLMITFYSEFDRKYSVDSIDERYKSTLKDFALAVGLDSNAFDKFQVFSSELSLKKYIGSGMGQFRGVELFDLALYRKLDKMRREREENERKKRNAAGETLPKE